MAIVYLGLGSNLGDRMGHIECALRELEQAGISIESRSSLIETEPQGGPPQGKFLNAVVRAVTDLDPLDLLMKIKSVERELGRLKTVPNGPRTIDIDILLYDHLRMANEILTIPHPRMWEREFVMKPLKEIDPDIRVPTSHAHHI